MVSAEELAGFLVKAAAAVGRLDLTLGPEDRTFRDLAIDDTVEGMPMPRPLDGVREQLLAGSDPGGCAVARLLSTGLGVH